MYCVHRLLEKAKITPIEINNAENKLANIINVAYYMCAMPIWYVKHCFLAVCCQW